MTHERDRGSTICIHGPILTRAIPQCVRHALSPRPSLHAASVTPVTLGPLVKAAKTLRVPRHDPVAFQTTPSSHLGARFTTRLRSNAPLFLFADFVKRSNALLFLFALFLKRSNAVMKPCGESRYLHNRVQCSRPVTWLLKHMC